MRNCIIGLIGILFVQGINANGQEERLIVRKHKSDASQFECEIKHAKFTSPKGWQPNQSGGKTYAILTRSDETYPKVSQMISIDIGKATEPTTQKLAESFAKKFKGQVNEDLHNVDGEKACRVTIPADKKSVRPVDCIVLVKDDIAFLFIGASKEAGDISKSIDELVKEWKWKK